MAKELYDIFIVKPIFDRVKFVDSCHLAFIIRLLIYLVLIFWFSVISLPRIGTVDWPAITFHFQRSMFRKAFKFLIKLEDCFLVYFIDDTASNLGFIFDLSAIFFLLSSDLSTTFFGIDK